MSAGWKWNGRYTILDRRAKTLSSYAGDTALPGGRIDDDDKTIEDTAVRPERVLLLV
jgi:8-oxo-dGTP pyrophosphatase MutT (NUDIX family)